MMAEKTHLDGCQPRFLINLRASRSSSTGLRCNHTHVFVVGCPLSPRGKEEGVSGQAE